MECPDIFSRTLVSTATAGQTTFATRPGHPRGAASRRRRGRCHSRGIIDLAETVVRITEIWDVGV